MIKEYYTAKEFAEIFDVSYRSILSAIKQGRIRAFKIGKGRRNPYKIHISEKSRIEVSGIFEVNPEISGTEQEKEE